MPKKVKTKKTKWSELENNLLKPAFKECVKRAKKLRVIWVTKYRDGSLSSFVQGTKKDAVAHSKDNQGRCIKFVECRS